MFTAYFLQEVLVKELEKIFKDDRFPTRNGERSKITIYEQYLPILDTKDTEDTQEELESGLLEEDWFDKIDVPYIQVILAGGKASTVNEEGHASVLLYLCAFDESEMRDGYKYLLNMMQKIQERFQKNSRMDNYYCEKEIQWELAETDDHPFYFGAMSMDFRLEPIRKEDDFC